MIKTVIMGTGRMGSLIRTTAEGIVNAAGEAVFDIVAQTGFDLSELENAPAADVIIDFSNVAAFNAVVAYVERTGAALVSGTTGYTPEQMDRLRELGQNARVMHSGNYSIGIAALRHLVAQATRELPGFDCEIVETHHNQKADAPAAPRSCCSTPSSKPSPRQVTTPSMAARACAAHATPRRSACTRCAVALSPACTR